MGTLRWTLIALAIAAIAELLIWRTFSRVGVFIPKGKASVMQTVYDISLQVGIILLNFAVILGVIALVLSFYRFRLGGELVRLGRSNSFGTTNRRSVYLSITLIATVVAMVASFVLLALVQNMVVTTTIRLTLLIAFTTLAADLWLRDNDWRVRLFVVLMLAGYWFQLAAKLLHDLVFPALGVDWQETVYQPMLLIGELAVVINGFVAYLAFTRQTSKERGPVRDILSHPKSLIGALVVVAVFLGLTFITVAESSIVPILGLYALGYEMQWPLPLYVISLFFLLYLIFYSLGEWRRGPSYRAVGLGLILLFAGGYTFQISDQYLFALVGVLLIARPELLNNPEDRDIAVGSGL